MTVTVAITKESVAGEKRVALDPSVVKKLVAAGGFQFRLQHGCGISAGFADVDYGDVVICSDFESTVKGCDIVLSCLLYTSPSPRDLSTSRMPSSA